MLFMYELGLLDCDLFIQQAFCFFEPWEWLMNFLFSPAVSETQSVNRDTRAEKRKRHRRNVRSKKSSEKQAYPLTTELPVSTDHPESLRESSDSQSSLSLSETYLNPTEDIFSGSPERLDWAAEVEREEILSQSIADEQTPQFLDLSQQESFNDFEPWIEAFDCDSEDSTLNPEQLTEDIWGSCYSRTLDSIPEDHREVAEVNLLYDSEEFSAPLAVAEDYNLQEEVQVADSLALDDESWLTAPSKNNSQAEDTAASEELAEVDNSHIHLVTENCVFGS